MKKLHVQEVKTCSACPNLTGQVLPRCKLLNDTIPINCNVYEQIYYRCPLPDFDNILEVMGNPKPLLTKEEEDALADCGDQVALGELDSQEALSRVFMTRLIPKHRN